LQPNTNCNQAIGVFDSGVGGLSVLKALREHLPHESFIYVADSGFAPYGPSIKVTRTGVVGVLATEQTINSNAVTTICKDHLETIRFLLQPCPGLVELVEGGDVSSDTV
jgi:glutamate racemase